MGTGKNWSQEELDYLCNTWGQRSIPSIANKLGRSIEAVKLKAGRLGLGRHIHNSTRITLNQFCEAIGKKNSYTHIKDRWGRLGFPIHYQKSIKKRFAMVDIGEFWIWAKDHKDMIDFSAFEENTLGKEPDWVKEARHASYLAKVNKSPWTAAEEQRLIDLLKQYRYTYNDLCTILNRTEGAIKRKIINLGLVYRPVRNYDRQWTDEEVDTLLKMRSAGHCFDEIGRVLKRSGSAVRGKYERLQNPDYCKRIYRRQREALKEYFQKDQCVHFVKTKGCDLKKTDCDSCTHFMRRTSEEAARTGWNRLHDLTPEIILKNIKGEEEYDKKENSARI